jgi:general secretion pathway protein M
MTARRLAAAGDWLAGRSLRERLLMALAAALAAGWIAIAVVWQPLVRHRAALEDRIARYERGLTALESAGLPAAASPAVTDDRAAPVILTDSAAQFDLAIRRLETDGAGARLVLEDTSFDGIILWIEALERDHGLTVTDIEMSRRPSPGIVGATFAVDR